MSRTMKMIPNNPEYATETKRILNQAPFISELGIQPINFEPGRCETRLEIQAKHLQQDGFVHAAVQAAIADHTAGAAASTLMAKGNVILSAEFKINLLRVARGNLLDCIATVLKPGRRLMVVESEVYCEGSGVPRNLVSKATVTLAVVDHPQKDN